MGFARSARKEKVISLVSPAHNEAGNIPLLVLQIEKVMEPLKGRYDYEYIIVDDGSVDRTWDEIVKMRDRNPRVVGIRLSRNFGQQIALTAGLDLAKGDAAIYFDSDLQHPPAIFPKMIREWERGYKVVDTVRTYSIETSQLKKILSELFYLTIRQLSNTPIQRGMADFKLLDREVLDQIRGMREHSRFLRGMVPWLGYKSAVVTYTSGKRAYGSPWYGFWRNLEFAKTAVLSFSLKPLKYVGYLGIYVTFGTSLVFVLSFLLSLVLKAWFLSPLVLLFLVNIFLAGITLSCLGIIALYLGDVYKEVINRPLYIITEAVGIKKARRNA